jgi:2,3-bisphosphoglycerate-independent phosphoglycerate mutase
LKEGKLGDIAPTLLALMGVPQPAEMTGENLLNAK